MSIFDDFKELLSEVELSVLDLNFKSDENEVIISLPLSNNSLILKDQDILNLIRRKKN